MSAVEAPALTGGRWVLRRGIRVLVDFQRPVDKPMSPTRHKPKPIQHTARARGRGKRPAPALRCTCDLCGCLIAIWEQCPGCMVRDNREALLAAFAGTCANPRRNA